MFANTQMMGMCMGFPDVCLTPTPAGPVPIPYPNIAMCPTAIPSQVKTMFVCMPAHNMATTIPLTNGDNAGVATGVASGMVMGPSRHMTGAFTVLVGAAPLTRMTSVSLQNSTNAPGMQIVPSQPKVLVLSP
ncbi:DUF4150 domain-containing protein [Viridibacterium curvum]|uniref:DUF4150 domain-containing protein n=1 Tax=Viridibacterium curvum TaxID=1101404 RepID=A0ABP9QNG8_9RHOO